MSTNTQRALEIIKPMANELKMAVDADDKFLYLDDIAIGISYNSTWATLMEFIGYVMVREYTQRFRGVWFADRQEEKIKRYWFTKDQLRKMGVATDEGID